MKIHLLSMMSIIFSFSITSMDIVPTPENTELYFDIDEVVIKGSSWTTFNIVTTGLKKEPLSAISYVQSLLALDKIYQKNSSGLKEALYDKNGNAIEGATYHWLEHGRRDPNLTRYVPYLLIAMEESRNFVPDMKEICNYLKAKGYTVHFATNKDRISYELVAAHLGKEFTEIPSKVFVAHPGNCQGFLDDIQQFAEQQTTPSCYKNLAYDAFSIRSSGTIIHASSRKPEELYYQCLLNNSKNKKFVFFIDDNPDNVNGFNSLQKKTNIDLRGILFKNPHQLTKELIMYGILSENSDQQFLKKMGWKL